MKNKWRGLTQHAIVKRAPNQGMMHVPKQAGICMCTCAYKHILYLVIVGKLRLRMEYSRHARSLTHSQPAPCMRLQAKCS